MNRINVKEFREAKKAVEDAQQEYDEICDLLSWCNNREEALENFTPVALKEILEDDPYGYDYSHLSD